MREITSFYPVEIPRILLHKTQRQKPLQSHIKSTATNTKATPDTPEPQWSRQHEKQVDSLNTHSATGLKAFHVFKEKPNPDPLRYLLRSLADKTLPVLHTRHQPGRLPGPPEEEGTMRSGSPRQANKPRKTPYKTIKHPVTEHRYVKVTGISNILIGEFSRP